MSPPSEGQNVSTKGFTAHACHRGVIAAGNRAKNFLKGV